MIESFLLVQTSFFRCNNSERKNFSHPFSALQSLKIRLLLKLFSFFPQYEPEKGFLKDSNFQILFCNFVISHICSTYSSCQKDSALLMMEMQCTVKEWAFIIWLKKAHNITNMQLANAVHSEKMSIYDLAKGHHKDHATQM